MRVRIGEFWLAGDPDLDERVHSQCAPPIWTPARSQQREEGLDWELAKYFDRKNASWAFDFQTTRRFDSEVDVMEWIAAYGSAHEWTGTVYAVVDTGSGTFAQFPLGGAMITPPQLTPNGVSLPINYHIEFQQFGAKETGAYADAPVRRTEANVVRKTQDDTVRLPES